MERDYSFNNGDGRMKTNDVFNLLPILLRGMLKKENLVEECLGRLKDAVCWFRFYVLLRAVVYVCYEVDGGNIIFYFDDVSVSVVRGYGDEK